MSFKVFCIICGVTLYFVSLSQHPTTAVRTSFCVNTISIFLFFSPHITSDHIWISHKKNRVSRIFYTPITSECDCDKLNVKIIIEFVCLSIDFITFFNISYHHCFFMFFFFLKKINRFFINKCLFISTWLI